MARLDDKVALLTGATGGIGMACTQRLIDLGAHVLLVDIDEAALAGCAVTFGSAVTCIPADVSDTGSDYIAQAHRLFGRIDVALLNAGIEGVVSPIDQTPIAAFDRVQQVNVRGVWIALTQMLPIMREQGAGSIIVTSSVTGLRGTAGLAPYVASKHAVLGLMKTAALEAAPWGVRVNAVCPGPTDTRMMQSIESSYDGVEATAMREKIATQVPMKRYGQAREIADVICFLAGPSSSFCTGGIFTVDGGQTAGPVR